jgi:hypothetical protein
VQRRLQFDRMQYIYNTLFCKFLASFGSIARAISSPAESQKRSSPRALKSFSPSCDY